VLDGNDGGGDGLKKFESPRLDDESSNDESPCCGSGDDDRTPLLSRPDHLALNLQAHGKQKRAR
jgi:hypothetical protein